MEQSHVLFDRQLYLLVSSRAIHIGRCFGGTGPPTPGVWRQPPGEHNRRLRSNKHAHVKSYDDDDASNTAHSTSGLAPVLLLLAFFQTVPFTTPFNPHHHKHPKHHYQHPKASWVREPKTLINRFRQHHRVMNQLETWTRHCMEYPPGPYLNHKK